MTRRALRAARPGEAASARSATRRRLPWLAWAALPVAAAIVWLALRASVTHAPPDAAADVRIEAGTIDEAGLLAASTDRLRVYRLRGASGVLVLLFPSLTAQARMLNRVGAFVEKSSAPRDRVLDDAELAGIIAAEHDSPESFYYGHDYRIADLRRFLAMADRDGIVLHPEERALRSLAALPDMGAVLSLPPLSDQQQIDPASRAAILRHEISHGTYFTDAAYAAYVRRFWETQMSAALRDSVRRFLGSEGYDTGNDDLVRNEMQAYLIYTQDPRYFDASSVGLTDQQAAALRHAFIAGIPDKPAKPK